IHHRLLRLALVTTLAALLPLGATPAALRAQATPATTTEAAAAPTTIIIVRHAEKAPAPADDPALSAEGQARARAIRDLLAAERVDAVIVTQFRRSRETAAPLAEARGITPEVVPAQRDVAAHAREVADHVLRRHAGRTVLVVGHSNTIQAIAAALGGGPDGEIDEREYDRVIVVVRPATGEARRIELRVGVAPR
ncbi:MAG TPA: phosphoglycerate mutase family protein, partial [Gemmatimonadaceae bacterium]|nr:phosphoglycerate mutase family protein [Gemmatimonadaceae bacterium]